MTTLRLIIVALSVAIALVTLSMIAIGTDLGENPIYGEPMPLVPFLGLVGLGAFVALLITLPQYRGSDEGS